ncbi:MAG: methyltransferase domain-containing protein [Salinibacter sp.]
MDDFSISDARLTRALRDLRRTNRLLGAYTATDAVLTPLFRRNDRLRILDVGCGGGDYVVHLTRQAKRFGCRAELIGLDANPVTVGHARAHLDEHLSPSLRSQVRIEIGDALALPVPDESVDVVHAALFLHHFHGENAVQLLSEMQRVARRGLLINDLHRHPLAYLGIWLLSRGLRMAPMVQHDGPMSVRRGFRKNELRDLARKAQLSLPSIRWHWAFRWTLSTISNWK